MTWDNNLEDVKLEDGAIALEHLEAGFTNGTHDGDHVVEMPPTPITRFPNVVALPLASQPRVLHGGCVTHGGVPQSLLPTSTPFLHRLWENKFEVSRGKRKA